MDTDELLKRLSSTLEELGVDYFVTGSLASIAYGESRFTNDIDVVADIQLEKAADFCARFLSPEFRCWEPSLREAIEFRRQFNILNSSTGLKVDVMIQKRTEFDDSRMRRRRRIKALDGSGAWFSSPEDIILKKLDFFRQEGSEKHLRDIAGILKVQAGKIDQAYVDLWIEKLKLHEEWILVNEWRTNPPKQPE